MEKINVAELLKDCPSGMELDCTMYENVTFEGLVEDTLIEFPILVNICNDDDECHMRLTKEGYWSPHLHAKCVIFPKGKTTWEGFVPPSKFKDGDVVRYSDCIAIFKEWGDATLFRTYVTAYLHGDSTIDVAIPLFGKSIRREARLATEEEKQKLFQAIKENGCKWNEETKTLEKLAEPQFKVGDTIKHKTHISQENIVTEIKDTHYILDDELALPFISQDDYELVPDKFDINTLVPFESRVLVRNDEGQYWIPAFWGCKRADGYTTTFGWCKYCIPYEDNKHLLGTTDDCDEFYKTWK